MKDFEDKNIYANNNYFISLTFIRQIILQLLMLVDFKLIMKELVKITYIFNAPPCLLHRFFSLIELGYLPNSETTNF